MKLTCPHCGNSRLWHNARNDSSGQSATCGDCGERVTSTGRGVEMDTVTGRMHFAPGGKRGDR